jgi:RNA polymerase sigma-70 factor (ECF subfamily)
VPPTVLQRVASGEAVAVDECLSKYGGLVWSLARRFCPRHEDAEDAVQDIFIDIWRNAERFDAEVASEATYITMIARRRLIDRYRRSGRSLDTTALNEERIGRGEC